jgi:hypothetical protein
MVYHGNIRKQIINVLTSSNDIYGDYKDHDINSETEGLELIYQRSWDI